MAAVVTLPDGTTARVHGQIEPEELQAIKDALPVRCGAASSSPMPALAQRIHGRETYTCAREEGHEGLHYQAAAGRWS